MALFLHVDVNLGRSFEAHLGEKKNRWVLTQTFKTKIIKWIIDNHIKYFWNKHIINTLSEAKIYIKLRLLFAYCTS